MPILTTISLDRLLEPSVSDSVDKTFHDSMPMPDLGHPNPRLTELDKRGGTLDVNAKLRRPMSPALYTTPEVTPLPDSPPSKSSSPYVVNHKRRGPRLLKSYSEGGLSDAPAHHKVEKGSLKQNGVNSSTSSVGDIVSAVSISKLTEVKVVNGVSGSEVGRNPMQPEHIAWEVGHGSLNIDSAHEAKSPKHYEPVYEKFGDSDNFYDPQDSLSCTSNPEDDNNSIDAGNRSSSNQGVTGDFFDAWEELSSESGQQPSSFHIEDELRGIRLSLLSEIEKRKQAEETLANMQSQWLRLKQELSLVGLTLPAQINLDSEQFAVEAGEHLREQVIVARVVADAIGRGSAKVEVETNMGAQMEAKNFELARLVDRLRYYEAANHEMSQRNQEAIERARRLREKRKRKKWIWGSVAVGLSLSTAALIWSFFPPGSGSSSINQSLELNRAKEAE